MGSDEAGEAPRGSGGPAARVLRWLLDRAERPGGLLVLVVLALLEATVFPAPTEAVLLALAIARPARAWWLGAVAAVASAAGGVIGYHLGLALFEEVARPVLASRGLLDQLDALTHLYRGNAFIVLASSAYTPIPYLLYTMAAGAMDVPLPTFVLGSLVGRALKYAPLAAVAYFFGPAARRIVERYAGWVAAAGLVVLLVFLALSR
jgi:membrane protein YqaA with SNARE-associated domain